MKKRINSVESSLGELSTRIKQVVDLHESRVSAASAAGVSTDMLSRYMRGSSQPAFAVMANLCAPVGVSLTWLASGNPPMMVGDLKGLEQARDELYRDIAGDPSAQAERDRKIKGFGTQHQAAKDQVARALKGRAVRIDDEQHLIALAYAFISRAEEPMNDDLLQDVADALCRGYEAERRLERVSQALWHGRES